MGAHRINLKQLLKIGTEVLATTAQTLSGAINEVRGNAASAYTAATTAYNKAGDALTAATDAGNLAEDAYVRAGLLEPPVGAVGAYIVGHATSRSLAACGSDVADTYGIHVSISGPCRCWVFGNGTNPAQVKKPIFEVTLQSGKYYYASYKDGNYSLSGLQMQVLNMSAAGTPVIAEFTSTHSDGTFQAPANSDGIIRAQVVLVFSANFNHSGPPMYCKPYIATENLPDADKLLADYYNYSDKTGALSLPRLREDVGALQKNLKALTDPAAFAPAGTTFTMLGVVTRHQSGADPLLLISFFIQNPALEAIVKKNSFQVTGVQITYYRNGVSNDSDLEIAFVDTYTYDAANRSLSVTVEVGSTAYAGTVDGSPALILAKW